MLQKLREKTSGWIAGTILTIVTIPFAFFGVESYMSQRVETYVARIAQPPSWWPSAPRVWPVTLLWQIEDIDAQTFKERFENARINLRNAQGDAFDPKAFESVENKRRVLDALIDEKLMQLTAQRDDIRISDAEVADTIARIPDFQVDGRFNADRYQMILAAQNPPLTPRAFEAKIREELATNLIPARIGRSAFVTDRELDRLMRLLGEHRDVAFVALPAPPADTAPVSEAEIAAWYKAHQGDYRSPETVRLEYVEVDGSTLPAPAVDEASLRKRYQEQIAKYSSPEKREVAHILVQLPANASEAERQAAAARANRLAAQARAPGADFAALARANSDDAGSKAAGGDLGWISKGAMPAAFEQAAFAMQPGEVRGPVKTEFGWHIIKLNQIQPGVQRPFEEVRQELEKQALDNGREQAFNELVSKLVDAVYKNPTSLAPAAQALGLKVQTTPAFSRAGAPGIASDPKVLRAAFSDSLIQDGTASDPIELGPLRTVMIRVIEHTPEQVLPLAQVRSAVIAAIHAERARKAADANAEALLAAARRQGLDAAANAAGLAVVKFDDLPRRSPAPVLPQPLVDAFFNVPRPQKDTPVLGKTRAGGQLVVFAVRAARDGDLTKVTAQERDQLRQQVAMALGAQEQEAFIKTVRSRYTITVAEDRL